MSSDDAFKPPRKKPSIFWWLGGAFSLLVVLFLFQLFGPSPPIEVSRETTFVTEPLLPSGMPDYERDLLDRVRDGVTPQNNAATLLVAALWPGDLSPNDYGVITTELGLPMAPTNGIRPLFKYIRGIVAAQTNQTVNDAATPVSTSEPDDAVQTEQEDPADKIYDRITNIPWTTQEFPEIAKWIANNQKQLDMLVEASHREHCYFPSPTLLNGQQNMLVGLLLPCQQGSREAGRDLLVRAMWHIGEHRPGEAWADTLATYRIGRLIAQGSCVVEELIGIAVSGMGLEGTVDLLAASPPSAELVKQMLHDLDSVQRFDRMADIVNHMERAMLLDAIIEMSQGTVDNASLLGLGNASTDYASILHRFRIDWNTVLRRANSYVDQYVAALSIEDPASRRAALNQVDLNLQNAASELGAKSFAVAAIDPAYRTNLVASTICAEWMSTISGAATAEDRANAQLDLTRVATGLAIFRAEHGSYPKTLEELEPDVFQKTPFDLFSGNALFYQRTSDGYLLYSVGVNGIDDAGSNIAWNSIEGQRFDNLNEAESSAVAAKIPAGADDLSIRMPRTKVKPSISNDRK